MNIRLFILSVLLIMSSAVFANGSLQHFSQAVDHSAQAVGHSTAAGMKLVSGAVAVPLMIGGEIGKASGEIGEALWEESNAPFPISEDVLTVGPRPSDAMKGKEAE